ncbi:hypothetical protein LCGC14_0460710 [marine sediment metagenome]|uniref:Uncharacterized protein n=1 Tax=marine sediment metagenome TaxID=412755 RepID=A0A0F9SK68_9ZZZZ|nr:hypothetical protein [bacterium]
MKKTTIGKFVIYASEMVPDGCIFFVHPNDEQLVVEALKMMEDLPLDDDQRKAAKLLMMTEMKKQLTKVEGEKND